MEKSELDKISKELNDELETLEKIRQGNAKRYDEMGDQELVDSLSMEYETVFKDAMMNGVELKIVSEENEED